MIIKEGARVEEIYSFSCMLSNELSVRPSKAGEEASGAGVDGELVEHLVWPMGSRYVLSGEMHLFHTPDREVFGGKLVSVVGEFCVVASPSYLDSYVELQRASQDMHISVPSSMEHH